MIAHIPKGWRYESQRLAGVALSVLVFVLILSGYLLYYLGIEWLRDWTSLLHWTIGLLLPAVFAWHYAGRNASKLKASTKAKGR